MGDRAKTWPPAATDDPCHGKRASPYIEPNATSKKRTSPAGAPRSSPRTTRGSSYRSTRPRDCIEQASCSVLQEDQSVASGRSMEQIARGEGRGPKPFMASGAKAADPRAVWNSNREEKQAKRAPRHRDKPAEEVRAERPAKS